jgi:hypothetical protein
MATPQAFLNAARVPDLTALIRSSDRLPRRLYATADYRYRDARLFGCLV